MNLTKDLLKELFHYDPETGIMTRLVSQRQGVGSVFGCKKPRGYVMGMINGKEYRVHRLIFIYMTGECPDEIDHINGDGHDNRWANLRPATHRQNMMNRKLNNNNKSGVMGVCWERSRNKWSAEIMVHQKKIHLGRYTEKSDAVLARKEAEQEYGFHVNHGRVM